MATNSDDPTTLPAALPSSVDPGSVPESSGQKPALCDVGAEQNSPVSPLKITVRTSTEGTSTAGAVGPFPVGPEAEESRCRAILLCEELAQELLELLELEQKTSELATAEALLSSLNLLSKIERGLRDGPAAYAAAAPNNTEPPAGIPVVPPQAEVPSPTGDVLARDYEKITRPFDPPSEGLRAPHLHLDGLSLGKFKTIELLNLSGRELHAEVTLAISDETISIAIEAPSQTAAPTSPPAGAAGLVPLGEGPLSSRLLVPGDVAALERLKRFAIPDGPFTAYEVGAVDRLKAFVARPVSVEVCTSELATGYVVSTVELLGIALPIHSQVKGERCWSTIVFDRGGHNVEEVRSKSLAEANQLHGELAAAFNGPHTGIFIRSGTENLEVTREEFEAWALARQPQPAGAWLEQRRRDVAAGVKS